MSARGMCQRPIVLYSSNYLKVLRLTLHFQTLASKRHFYAGAAERSELEDRLLNVLQKSATIKQRLQSLQISKKLRRIVASPASTQLTDCSNSTVSNVDSTQVTLQACLTLESSKVSLVTFFDLLQNTSREDRPSTFSRLIAALLKQDNLLQVIDFLPILSISRIKLDNSTISHLLRKGCSFNDPAVLVKIFEYCYSMKIRPPEAVYGSLIMWNCARPSASSQLKRTESQEWHLSRFNAIIQGTLNDADRSKGILPTSQETIDNYLSKGLIKEAWESFRSCLLEGANVAHASLLELSLHASSIEDFKSICSHPLLDVPVLACILKSPWVRSMGLESRRLVFHALLLMEDSKCTLAEFADFFREIGSKDLPFVLAGMKTCNNQVLRDILIAIRQLNLIEDCKDFRLLVDGGEYKRAFAKLFNQWFCQSNDITMELQFLKSLISSAGPLQSEEIDWSKSRDVILKAVISGNTPQLVVDLLAALLENGLSHVMKPTDWNLVFRELYNRGDRESCKLLLTKIDREKRFPQSSRIFAEMLLSRHPSELASRCKNEIAADIDQNEFVVSTAMHCFLHRHRFEDAVDLLHRIRPPNRTVYMVSLALQAAALSENPYLIVRMRQEIQNSGLKDLLDTFRKAILSVDAPSDITDSKAYRAFALAALLVYYRETDARVFSDAFFRFFSGSLRPDLDCARAYLHVLAHSSARQEPEFGPRFWDWLERRSLTPPDQSIYTKLLHLAGRSKDENLLTYTITLMLEKKFRLSLPIVNELFGCLDSFDAPYERLAQVARLAQQASIILKAAHFDLLIEAACREAKVSEAMEWCRSSILLDRRAKIELICRLTNDVLSTRKLKDCLEWLHFLSEAQVSLSKPILEKALWLCVGSGQLSHIKRVFKLSRKHRCLPRRKLIEAILKSALLAGDVGFALKVWNDIRRSHNSLIPELCDIPSVLGRYVSPLLSKIPEIPLRFQPLASRDSREALKVLQWAINNRAILSHTFCWSGIKCALMQGDLATAQEFHIYITSNGLEVDRDFSEKFSFLLLPRSKSIPETRRAIADH